MGTLELIKYLQQHQRTLTFKEREDALNELRIKINPHTRFQNDAFNQFRDRIMTGKATQDDARRLGNAVKTGEE